MAVREDFPSGAIQTALVSGGAGGEVAELAVGRSGLGDGLIAFRQGPFGDAAIVAAQATAPASEVVVSAPKGWIKPSQALITWEPAVSADGPLSYSVVLDGRVLPAPAGSLQMRLDPRGLGAGRHSVQLLATDIDGQSTLSAPSPLLIDGELPAVTIARAIGGYGVSVQRPRSLHRARRARDQRQLRRRSQRPGPQAASCTATPARASTRSSSTCATSSATPASCGGW